MNRIDFPHMLGWHNYRTDQIEWLSDLPPDERMDDFLPWVGEYPTGGNMYRTLLKLGYNKPDAMLRVLKAALGEHDDADTAR